MMTIKQIRTALTAMGFRVKLSRRNGIRAAVEVTVFMGAAHDYRTLSAGGNTDLEAFQGALAQVEALKPSESGRAHRMYDRNGNPITVVVPE